MTNESQVQSTLSLDQVADQVWDLAIMGAGPAGAMSAIRASQLGAHVLLIDRACFPRSKVCGCCLNGAALDVLRRAGLGHFAESCDAIPLRSLSLASNRRAASIILDQGVALSRERMDTELIRHAIQSGVQFIDETQAVVGDLTDNHRTIYLQKDSARTVLSSRGVIAACGLSGRVFQERTEDESEIAEGSRIGAGTTVDANPEAYPPGKITMCCHRDGYVGLVQLENRRLDIAAAIDPKALNRSQTLPKLIAKIIDSAGCKIPEGLHAAAWHGTPKLTRRRVSPSAERCFLAGDAARYVEPFTGEGMAWALASGKAAADVAVKLLESNSPSHAADEWERVHTQLIGQRTRLCSWLSRCLRYPRLINLALPFLRVAPQLAAPAVKSLNRPFQD